MVGRYDVGTSLRDVLFQMKYILGDRGQRICPLLLHLKKERVFALILAVLDEASDEIYQYTATDFLPARFDVRIPVDVFDSWKIFLVEGRGEAKILYKRIESSEVLETILAVGEFDIIFNEACIYLERLLNAEIAGGEEQQSRA